MRPSTLLPIVRKLTETQQQQGVGFGEMRTVGSSADGPADGVGTAAASEWSRQDHCGRCGRLVAARTVRRTVSEPPQPRNGHDKTTADDADAKSPHPSEAEEAVPVWKAQL